MTITLRALPSRGFRRVLLLLAMTAGLLVLSVLCAATAQADEIDPVGDGLDAVRTTVAAVESEVDADAGDDEPSRDPVEAATGEDATASTGAERDDVGGTDASDGAGEVAAPRVDAVPEIVSEVLDAPVPTARKAAAGLPEKLAEPVEAVPDVATDAAGALSAPTDLVVRAVDTVGAPTDLVVRAADTTNELAGALGAPVTITAEPLPERGLATVTVTVEAADPVAEPVAAGPTEQATAAAGVAEDGSARPAPSADVVSGVASVPGSPAAYAGALPPDPVTGPASLAHPDPTGAVSAAGSPVGVDPPRPLAALPGPAPAPAGGGNGAANALLPVAALLVPPALLRRVRQARGGRVVSLSPTPGERPG